MAIVDRVEPRRAGASQRLADGSEKPGEPGSESAVEPLATRRERRAYERNAHVTKICATKDTLNRSKHWAPSARLSARVSIQRIHIPEDARNLV